LPGGAHTQFNDGIWAPPGNYTVALTVDGKTYTQPLTIAPDPRVNLPMAAYVDQAALGREIEALRAAVAAALDEAEKFIANPETNEADRKRAAEISDVNSPEMWWLAPRSTSSLRFLDNQLEKLQQAVNDADAAPTQDARDGFAKVRPVAEAALAAWRAVRGGH